MVYFIYLLVYCEENVGDFTLHFIHILIIAFLYVEFSCLIKKIKIGEYFFKGFANLFGDSLVINKFLIDIPNNFFKLFFTIDISLAKIMHLFFNLLFI